MSFIFCEYIYKLTMDKNVVIAIIVILVIIAIILYVILSGSVFEKVLEVSVTPITYFVNDSEVNHYRQNQLLQKLLELCAKHNIRLTKTQSNMSYITVVTNKGFKTIPLYEVNYMSDYMSAMQYINNLTDPKSVLVVRLNDPPVKKIEPVEPVRLAEVSYNLVSKFFQFPLYNDNNQMLLEKELNRLCGNANIKSTKTDTLKSEIKVTTNRGVSKIFSLASNYIEGFGECFLYMNQFLQDKYPMKGTDVNITQVVYAQTIANVPIIVDLVKELSKPEGRYIYRGALKLKIIGKSSFCEYITPQPKMDSFINFVIKIDDQIFSKATDLSEIINIPLSDVKDKIVSGEINKSNDLFDKKYYPVRELQFVDTNGYPVSENVSPVMQMQPAGTAAPTQGMNGFKEASRKYR